jgi:DNA-directed RNA polymerase subunit M/transcription elongation factor TFIIS
MEVVPATNKNAKAKAKAKANKNNKDKESTGNLGSVPEGAVTSSPTITDPLTSENRQDSGIRFCPVCRYYLYLEVSGEDQSLHRLCRNCGHREEDTKGGMVMEMMVQERSAEGYKILLNEFTRQDPRLPHIRKNIKCPEPTCDSNHGKKDPDIIYIKYDAVNMLYLYICDICGFQWRSARS